MRHLAFALTALAAPAGAQTLTVMTYDSFVPDWGAGPAIEAGFEAACGCEMEFVGAGDGASLLSRLELEGAATDADVVLGLDANLMERARATGLLAPHGIEARLDLPVTWTDDTFLPFDWGWFAFVANEGTPAPRSLKALAASDLSVVIQDPRASTPGLGLALWVQATQGDPTAFWEAMSDNVLTVTPGWSEAYGLFLSGEADAVLSYTTSPAYHLIAEGDDTRRAWLFDDGHPAQIELAAVVASTDQPERAREFLAYLVSDEAQSILPTTNWMYPAATPEAGLPEGFATLPIPGTTVVTDPGAREAAIEAWRSGLSR
ncbi:MAG: thiamine ABC transporter substrate-binding protein [Paracoccaceae bacterium]